MRLTRKTKIMVPNGWTGEMFQDFTNSGRKGITEHDKGTILKTVLIEQSHTKCEIKWNGQKIRSYKEKVFTGGIGSRRNDLHLFGLVSLRFFQKDDFFFGRPVLESVVGDLELGEIYPLQDEPKKPKIMISLIDIDDFEQTLENQLVLAKSFGNAFIQMWLKVNMEPAQKMTIADVLNCTDDRNKFQIFEYSLQHSCALFGKPLEDPF